jgi:L-iditol 2-dehydrogenase
MTSFETRAFVYHGSPGKVTTETVTFDARPTDLVVEVLTCGRCGTDKVIYKMGHKNVDPFAPVVLGHELVGRIVHVGEEVSSLTSGIGYREGSELSDAYLDFQLGERVVFQSRIARYRDGLMLVPEPIANLSFQINGGYSRYMRVPETLIRSESVLRVPDRVSDEAACLVEPAACALESVYATPHPTGVDEEGRHLYRAGIKPGGNTCVIGSGTVSMVYARLARLEGARRVVMLVRSSAKAELVRDTLGAEAEVYQTPRLANDASDETLEAEKGIVTDLREMTDGYLFDDVVVACASTSAQRLMLQLYTGEGYAVGACFGGTHRTVDRAEIDLNHYRAAKTIGTSGCSTDGMKTILKWMEAHRLDLDGLMARRHFTLDDDPHEFFTTEAEGLKPALYPLE